MNGFKLYSMILVAIVMLIVMRATLKAKDDMFVGLIVVMALLMPLWWYVAFLAR